MTERQALRSCGVVGFVGLFAWAAWDYGRAGSWSASTPWVLTLAIALSPLSFTVWDRYTRRAASASRSKGVGVAAGGLGLLAYHSLPDLALFVFFAASVWAFAGLAGLAIWRWSHGEELWPKEGSGAIRGRKASASGRGKRNQRGSD